MHIPILSLSNPAIDSLIRIALLFFFLAVYGFTTVIGVSIFLHFRWFGLADKSQRVIEWLFVSSSLVIFFWNVGILFALSK
jgi:hypothetical protein